MLFLFFNFTPLYGHNPFADFLSNFYVFLHFWRFLRFKNTILCKFADKIPKKRRFCQHRKICFSSRLHRTKRKSKKTQTIIQSVRGLSTVCGPVQMKTSEPARCFPCVLDDLPRRFAIGIIISLTKFPIGPA